MALAKRGPLSNKLYIPKDAYTIFCFDMTVNNSAFNLDFHPVSKGILILQHFK